MGEWMGTCALSCLSSLYTLQDTHVRTRQAARGSAKFLMMLKVCLLVRNSNTPSEAITMYRSCR